jgi:DNA-3-methyladenine glycosylase II
MGRSLQGGDAVQSVESLPEAESILSARDPILAALIASQRIRWPSRPTEEPLWGLIRMIVAQQISTAVACRLAERIRSAYPNLTAPLQAATPNLTDLRSMGLSTRRAQCCLDVLARADTIRADVERGMTWNEALAGIKGIGPWTLSVFRIMVLREPDVLPLGDVGLNRAIVTIYGQSHAAEHLGEAWRPFRSVACWYLWKTLGNEQLG